MQAPMHILVVYFGGDRAKQQCVQCALLYESIHPQVRMSLRYIEKLDKRQLQQTLQQIKPDGLLLNGSTLPDTLSIPTVSIYDFSQPTIPNVAPDQTRIGCLAAKHLLSLALPHYAFAALAGQGWCGEMRWQGFRDQMQQAGHEPLLFDDAFPSPLTNITDLDLYAWLKKIPKPIGIHTMQQHLGQRIACICRELKLHIPHDVALICGIDFPLIAETYRPSLSAISFDHVRMFHTACDILRRIMQGERPPVTTVRIPPAGIIMRQSSDRRGASDPEVRRVRERIAIEAANRPMSVKELVASSSLSRRMLEIRFTREVGHTMHDEIMLARIRRAQQLLQLTQLPIRKVALMSGFITYRAFNVAFQKYTGQTASVCRKHAP